MTNRKFVTRICAALAILIVLPPALILGILLIQHNLRAGLPKPAGPYAVGRATLLLQSLDQKALLSPGPRTAFVWLWYPAQDGAGPCEYLPADWRAAINRTRGFPARIFLNTDLSKVQDQSRCGANLSSKEKSYPVVMLRAGASALVTQYTALAEDLASHGYIVVAFDIPYRSELVALPGGNVIARLPTNNAETLSGEAQIQLGEKLVQAWASDTSWVLDELGKTNLPAGMTGRLDFMDIGMVGHSLGGGTAAQFCHDDQRCKAGIDIDGVVLGDVVKQGVPRPFMILLGEHAGDTGVQARQIEADLQSFYDRLPPDTRMNVTLPDAGHFNFGDAPFVNNPLAQTILRMTGALDGRRQAELTALYVRAFFDAYLKGAPSAGLKKLPTN